MQLGNINNSELLLKESAEDHKPANEENTYEAPEFQITHKIDRRKSSGSDLRKNSVLGLSHILNDIVDNPVVGTKEEVPIE